MSIPSYFMSFVVIICLIAVSSCRTSNRVDNPPPPITNEKFSFFVQLQGDHYPCTADYCFFDMWKLTTDEVKYLNQSGNKSICYFSAGSWESWRLDANKFSAKVIGEDNGWPGEKWLDIR
jgi:hypothetical protein